MTLSHVSEREENRHSIKSGFRGRTGIILALILFSTWFLGTTAIARVGAASGQDGSVQSDHENSQAGPGQQAAEAKEVSRPAPGEADAPSAQASKDQTQKSNTPSDEKKKEWVIAPIPINSPAIGAGLEWAVGLIFPLNKNDKISPPSAVAVGGVFTNNDSHGIALGGRLYFKEDKYRITAGVGTANVNWDITGIGKPAGDQGITVPLNIEGGGGLGEFLYGLKKGVFLGLRSQYRNLNLSLNQETLSSPDFKVQPPERVKAAIDEIEQDLFKQKTVSIGPRFQLDTRDNTFYPKKGVFMDFGLDLFSKSLGSQFTYQYYKAAFNKYSQIGKHQVLAYRCVACAATGDHVPIYDLCLFGAMNDLRGYAAGRYQDRRMFATQAEYRLMLPVQGFWGRFGVVAFAGFGAVGNKFSSIGYDDLLPAGGGGLRFRLTKKHPINYRIDYGFGKGGSTLSIGILEAF